ncbi:MAG TPA: helix-turn-helix transcriptional regulator [Bryobacteraceae bacterium]|nr:helix-turn-helix transcriptional regulator [Bryobacteraceae bacterium]HPT25284.1 helix-turn-helix transcriptional regulator [Bryobacteraceae bacterium]
MLLALAEERTAWHHGYDLCLRTGLKAGSMYPILMRLADRELLGASWERELPSGRPPRHLYRLTNARLEAVLEVAKAREEAGRTRPAVRGLREGLAR